MGFKIDVSDILRLEIELGKLRVKALPFATKSAINGIAFAAQKIAREGVKSTLINRNRFTANSIRVNPTKSLDISTQQSSVGSTADYMEIQEFGGTKSKKGKKGTPIPTSYSAGQAQEAVPRRRLPTRANKLGNIMFRRGKSGKRQTAKQRVFVTIKLAVASPSGV